MVNNIIRNSDYLAFNIVLGRKIKELKMLAASKGKPCCDMRILVSWGGGKDSTLALLLAAGLAQELGCQLFVYTMLHPGLTNDVFYNIEAIVKVLKIKHQFRSFNLVVNDGSINYNKDWSFLYQNIWRALKGFPRFMCVACNWGATVTEYSALCDTRADVHVTGNPAWELSGFKHWLEGFRRNLKTITFPPEVGNLQLDESRAWWAIYGHLIAELWQSKEAGEQWLYNSFDTLRRRFLYPFPDDYSPIKETSRLCILDNEAVVTIKSERSALLSRCGWKLPDDIQGGTESDCQFTSVIASLNIRQKGLSGHLKDLKKAKAKFDPLPEMSDRAFDWAVSGRSKSEGDKLLKRLNLETNAESVLISPVAQALAGELFPVR